MLLSVITILLATILQSADIGEFFTLGDWIPDAVSPEDTYGSDANTDLSKRWVVEKDVPRLVDMHTITVPAYYRIERLGFGDNLWTNITSEVGQPYWDGQGMNISSSILEGELLEDAYPYYGGTDRYADSGTLEWDSDAATYQAEAIRFKDIAEYVIETNQLWVPKAQVLSTNNQAAVLSAFAGWMERAYYAGLGPSNVWDEAVYGPRDDLRKFRFDVSGGGFVYTPTNRVIDTRRLTEGGNIRNLYVAVHSNNQDWGFKAERPSWGNEQMQWAFSGLAMPTASGTITDIGLKGCVFDWQSDLVNIGWEECLHPLNTIYSQSGWGGDYYPWESKNSLIDDLLPQLWFGEPWNSVGGEGPKSKEQEFYTNYISFDDIVTNVYPHSVDILTNSLVAHTQRLNSECLGITCQALSLLDRSYYEVNGYYKWPTTNITYSATKILDGTVHADITIDIEHSSARLDRRITANDIVWTDRYVVMTNAWDNGRHRSMYSQFSGTSDGADERTLRFQSSIDMTLTRENFINACEELNLARGEYDVYLTDIYKLAGRYTAGGWVEVPPYYTPYIDVPLEVNTSISNATLLANITGRRSYTIFETSGSNPTMIGGLNHPGPLAYDRNKVLTNVVLGVSGYAVRDTYSHFSDAVDDMYSDAVDTFAAQYSSCLYDYSNAYSSALPTAEYLRVISALHSGMRSHIGTDPITDPLTILTINDDDVAALKDHLAFEQGRVRASRVLSNGMIVKIKVLDDASIEIKSIQGRYPDEIEADLPFRYGYLEFDFPEESGISAIEFSNPIDSRSSTGHTAFLQQVDWNWSTLKPTLED